MVTNITQCSKSVITPCVQVAGSGMTMIVKEFVTEMLHMKAVFWEQKEDEEKWWVRRHQEARGDKLQSVNDDNGILTRESHFVTKTDYEQTLI